MRIFVVCSDVYEKLRDIQEQKGMGYRFERGIIVAEEYKKELRRNECP